MSYHFLALRSRSWTAFFFFWTWGIWYPGLGHKSLLVCWWTIKQPRHIYHLVLFTLLCSRRRQNKTVNHEHQVRTIYQITFIVGCHHIKTSNNWIHVNGFERLILHNFTICVQCVITKCYFTNQILKNKPFLEINSILMSFSLAFPVHLNEF